MAHQGPRNTRNQQTSVASHINLGGGLSQGLKAFATVYLLMFVFFLIEMGSARGGLGRASGLVLILLPLAFVFSSHVGATVMGFGGAGQFFQIPVFVYYLVPIGVLVWGGYRLARTVDTPDATARGAAGASVTAGYLVAVVVLIVVLSSLSGPTTSQTSQQLPVLILVTGLIYPLVFGTAGGLLAHIRADDPAGAAGTRGRPRGGHQQPGGGAAQGGQQRQQAQGQHAGPDQHTEQARGQPPQQGGSPQTSQPRQEPNQERRRDQR